MAIIKIPSYYEPFVSGAKLFTSDAKTAGGVLTEFLDTYPDIKPLIYTHWGILSANVVIYKNQDEIFTLQGLETPMSENDRLILVPTASGG